VGMHAEPPCSWFAASHYKMHIKSIAKCLYQADGAWPIYQYWELLPVGLQY
jgi:hypothetical protein